MTLCVITIIQLSVMQMMVIGHRNKAGSFNMPTVSKDFNAIIMQFPYALQY